jgi:hypothetical protein
MSNTLDTQFADLASKDDKVRYAAFKSLLAETESKVSWFADRFAYLAAKLESDNSYQRSIGIMLLCNLAKSDTEGLLGKVLPDILSHMHDEKFITSRQCIQSVWKIAVAQPLLSGEVISALKKIFHASEGENHYSLIRRDILQSMQHINESTPDLSLEPDILALITSEQDAKYQKAYKKSLGLK